MRLGLLKLLNQVLLLLSLLLKHVLGRIELVLRLHELLLDSVQVEYHVIDGLYLGQGPLTHDILSRMGADREDALAFTTWLVTTGGAPS